MWLSKSFDNKTHTQEPNRVGMDFVETLVDGRSAEMLADLLRERMDDEELDIWVAKAHEGAEILKLKRQQGANLHAYEDRLRPTAKTSAHDRAIYDEAVKNLRDGDAQLARVIERHQKLVDVIHIYERERGRPETVFADTAPSAVTDDLSTSIDVSKSMIKMLKMSFAKGTKASVDDMSEHTRDELLRQYETFTDNVERDRLIEAQLEHMPFDTEEIEHFKKRRDVNKEIVALLEPIHDEILRQRATRGVW